MLESVDDYSIEQEIDINDDNSVDNKSFLDLEYTSDEVQITHSLTYSLTHLLTYLLTRSVKL